MSLHPLWNVSSVKKKRLREIPFVFHDHIIWKGTPFVSSTIGGNAAHYVFGLSVLRDARSFLPPCVCRASAADSLQSEMDAVLSEVCTNMGQGARLPWPSEYSGLNWSGHSHGGVPPGSVVGALLFGLMSRGYVGTEEEEGPSAGFTHCSLECLSPFLLNLFTFRDGLTADLFMIFYPLLFVCSSCFSLSLPGSLPLFSSFVLNRWIKD